jgi:cytochrome c biogenesis protein CcmG, thiol:disulfide interchange protein DsbE
LTRDVADEPPEPAELGEVLENPPTSGLVSVDTTGDAVPSDRVENLAGGKLSLTDYAGQPMVVNFFGSWCVPCRKEMPDLQRVHERYGDRVAFVGIAVNDTAKDARAFMTELGVTYDAGLDSGGNLYPAFGSAVMPTTALVSSDGHIVKVVAGALTAERLQQLIRDELGA